MPWTRSSWSDSWVEILGLFRVADLQFGELIAQVFDPVLIRGSHDADQRTQTEVLLGVGGVGAPDGFEFLDLGLVAFAPRLGEVEVELCVVGGATGDLASADVGGEQFGAQFYSRSG